MPGFPFSTVEPNQIGQVTKWDVPLNDWLGIKFQSAHEDTLGVAVSRATEDFIWDDHNPVRPDVLNRVYGIEGQLKFDKPLSAQRARLMNERKRKELETESYLESASHSWASGKALAGFGAALVGGLSHPLDFGATFLPFVGSEKAATSVANLGGSSFRQALARGVVSEEALVAARVPAARLTGAVIDGVVNQAVMEIPIAIQKYRDQANYGLPDAAFNILAGGAFSGAIKGLGLALERAGRWWKEADPRIKDAAVQDAVRTTVTGEPSRTHEFFGMDESVIRAKVEERVRAENPLPEFRTEKGEPIPPPEPGMVRLYRGQEDASAGGTYWSSDPEYAASFGGKVQTVDVPEAVAAKARADFQATGSGTPNAHILPNEWQRNAVDMTTPPEPKVFDLDSAASDIRQDSGQQMLTKFKADHEAKIKGLVDAETQRAIAEVQRQNPPTPKEEVQRYSMKDVPDDANIKTVEEDAQAVSEQVLSNAKTPEAREALQAEIESGWKALEEEGLSGEKAIDEMTPCITKKLS